MNCVPSCDLTSWVSSWCGWLDTLCSTPRISLFHIKTCQALLTKTEQQQQQCNICLWRKWFLVYEHDVGTCPCCPFPCDMRDVIWVPLLVDCLSCIVSHRFVICWCWRIPPHPPPPNQSPFPQTAVVRVGCGQGEETVFCLETLHRRMKNTTMCGGMLPAICMSLHRKRWWSSGSAKTFPDTKLSFLALGTAPPDVPVYTRSQST